MKKLRMVAVLLLCTLLLSACGGGSIAHVTPVIGPSELFTDQEVSDAMDIVLDYFQREFDGCTLTELQYDEEAVKDELNDWAAQYDESKAIVLLSSFEVDGSGGDGSLNPDSTYENWKWVLTRSGGGAWTLRTWGYG